WTGRRLKRQRTLQPMQLRVPVVLSGTLCHGQPFVHRGESLVRRLDLRARLGETGKEVRPAELHSEVSASGQPLSDRGETLFFPSLFGQHPAAMDLPQNEVGAQAVLGRMPTGFILQLLHGLALEALLMESGSKVTHVDDVVRVVE